MTPQELRAFVAVMREVGAVQAEGIILGPEPTKLATLEAKAAKGEQVDPAQLEAERRRARLEELRQEVRDKVGQDLPDAVCDRMIDPAALEAA